MSTQPPTEQSEIPDHPLRIPPELIEVQKKSRRTSKRGKNPTLPQEENESEPEPKGKNPEPEPEPEPEPSLAHVRFVPTEEEETESEWSTTVMEGLILHPVQPENQNFDVLKTFLSGWAFGTTSILVCYNIFKWMYRS